MPEFQELPFTERPDLSPYLIHLTKNTKKEDDYSAFENLVSILKTGRIWGSDKKKGFIKGRDKAACFVDIPLISLKYVLNKANSDPEKPRYEPFGVLVTKKQAYEGGCRPVLYLSDEELGRMRMPDDELWRVVRFEVKGKKWTSWLHEREWRCKGDFQLPKRPLPVLVKHTKWVAQLNTRLADESEEFKALPKSIIPLTIACQGLKYL